MQSNKEFYDKNGYFIVKKLIPEVNINKILKSFEDFKISNSLFFSQSEHNWRRTKSDLDEYGLLSCSLENFTDLICNKKLSHNGRSILQSQNVLDILKKLSKEEDFCIWQNMFFDKSTGTVDHIDSFYLDTIPMGELIAAWFALEDINGDGGAFHIYPGSHLIRSNEWKGMNHDDYIKWSKTQTKYMEKKVIFLEKGDVLFWHPFLFHGSSSQKIKGSSRKSLTAHYFPSHFLKGGGGQDKDPKSEIYKTELKLQQKKYRDYGFPIFSTKRRRDNLSFYIKGLIHYIFHENKPHKLMNRRNYE